MQTLELNDTLDTNRLGELPRPATSHRTRVLAITSELPWPLNTGGHIRTFHLLRSLAEQFDVRLLTVVESKDIEHLEQLRKVGIDVRAAVIGPRRSWNELARVTVAAMRREPYVMYRRHDRGELRRLVRTELAHETPEVVYLDHLDPFVFRSLIPDGVRLIADLHNVYSRLTERVAEEHRGPKGMYLRREASLLAGIERRVARAADLVMTVSNEEQETFRSLGGRDVRLVPNGVDCQAYAHLPVGRDSLNRTPQAFALPHNPDTMATASTPMTAASANVAAEPAHACGLRFNEFCQPINMTMNNLGQLWLYGMNRG